MPTEQYIAYSSRGGSGGTGVASLNSLTGALTLVAGSGITITPSGSNITISSTDISAAILSINADTTAAQTLSVGTAGTDFAIVDAGGGSHVFNLPTASASNRGALSSADWSTFNSKQSTLTFSDSLVNTSGTVTLIGDSASPGSAVYYGTNGTGTLGYWSLSSLAGFANTTLSNLVSPTAVNQNLIPGINDDLSLGSPAYLWGICYIDSLYDASDNPSIHLLSRELLDANGTVSALYDARQLIGTTGSDVSIDWGNRSLNDSASTEQLSWSTSGVEFNQLSPSTVPYLNASSILTSSIVTPTELGYVHGVTSAIQTQLNGKQASGNYITALTGDASASGPGSAALTLATVNSNVGSFGSSTAIPSFTVNAKGLITAASTNAVVAPAGTLTGTTLASNVVTSSLTSLGTQSTTLDLGSNQIINVVDPTSAQMAATKNYVDTQLAQLNPLASVYAATTPAGGNIAGTYLNGVSGVGATFTTTATGTFTVDGTTPTLGARILIKNQTSGFQNGVYTITTLGTIGVSTVFTRALDFDTAADMNAGQPIPVINGTVNASSSWYQSATITTVGTDSLVFSVFTLPSSSYLQVANNLSDVASASTAFKNISPMTTAGDMIYENSTPAPARLAIGTTGQMLTVVGGLPAWSSASALTAWAAYTPTITGCGTVSNVAFFWRQVGDTDEVRGTFTAGTVTSALVSFTLPNGDTIQTGKITIANTTSSPGPMLGSYGNTGTSGAGPIVCATGTSTSLVYGGGVYAASNMLIPAGGSSSFNSNGVSSVIFSFPAR